MGSVMKGDEILHLVRVLRGEGFWSLLSSLGMEFSDGVRSSILLIGG
jgi:hypothetical protein